GQPPRAGPGRGDSEGRRRVSGRLGPGLAHRRVARRRRRRAPGSRTKPARPRERARLRRTERPECPDMNWLTDYVRPKIKALVRSNRPEVPENLWVNCPSCERMIFHRDLETNQRVCPHCSHHFRVGPDYRFHSLFDPDSWTKIELPRVAIDPLKFRDRRRYIERLKEAQSKTGKADP